MSFLTKSPLLSTKSPLLSGTRAFWRMKGDQFGNVDDSLSLSHPLSPACMSVDFGLNLLTIFFKIGSTVVIDVNRVDVVDVDVHPSVEDHMLSIALVSMAVVCVDDDDEVTLKCWSPDDDADNADLDDVPVPPPAAKKLRQSLLAFTYK
jgi:hypothetical protein